MKTDHYEGVYPITNLKFLEGHLKLDDKVDQQTFPNIQHRPTRKAAKLARDKLRHMAN